MIQYINGDIFQSTMQTLVCPVNTVGVMGKGLAKEFARRHPKMEEEYKGYCAAYDFKIGKLLIYSDSFHRQVLLFPTKGHWYNKSQLVYIDEGLDTFALTYKYHGIRSIAFPKLGCGLGGLDWLDVVKLFEKYLGDIDIPVEVYGSSPKWAEHNKKVMGRMMNLIDWS